MKKQQGLQIDITECIAAAAGQLDIDPQDVTYEQFMGHVKRLFNDADVPFNLISVQGEVKKCGGFQNIKDSQFKPVVTEAAAKNVAVARANRKEAKDTAGQSLFLSQLTANLVKLVQPVSVSNFKLPQKAKYLERTQHLIISDTHFGSDLDPRVGIRRYNVEEESRSLAKICVEAAEYKRQYRKETKLIVPILGDLLAGKLHDREYGAPLSQQMARAIHVMVEGLLFLCTQYPSVEAYGVGGNHDRISSRHSGRATSGKEDNNAIPVYYAIKKALSRVPNFKMSIPMSSIITYEANGNHYYNTHGDTNFNIPNPNSNLNPKNIENSVNKINAQQNGTKYKVVVVGHHHSGMILHLTNGVTLLVNPPLTPVDQYAAGLNIDPDAPTGQWLFESVQGHAVGDSRFLEVTEKDRQDESLNKIIPVFEL
jgi:predicted phosphodiesterase